MSWDDRIEPWHIITMVVLLLVGLIVYAVWEEDEWQRYKVEHNCQMTDEDRWVPIVICTPVGKSTICNTVMTEQHKWTCEGDDGEEHWRSDDED